MTNAIGRHSGLRSKLWVLWAVGSVLRLCIAILQSCLRCASGKYSVESSILWPFLPLQMCLWLHAKDVIICRVCVNSRREYV